MAKTLWNIRKLVDSKERAEFENFLKNEVTLEFLEQNIEKTKPLIKSIIKSNNHVRLFYKRKYTRWHVDSDFKKLAQKAIWDTFDSYSSVYLIFYALFLIYKGKLNEEDTVDSNSYVTNVKILSFDEDCSGIESDNNELENEIIAYPTTINVPLNPKVRQDETNNDFVSIKKKQKTLEERLAQLETKISTYYKLFDTYTKVLVVQGIVILVNTLLAFAVVFYILYK